MPISDPEGYDKGHFKRVYEDLIKPACRSAGYDPIRADDVLETNLGSGPIKGLPLAMVL